MTTPKHIFITLFLLCCTQAQAQSPLLKIVRDAPQMALPYSSLNRDKSYLEKKKILRGADSLNFINVLKNLTLEQVNRYNGGFSNADCFLKSEDSTNNGLTQNCLEAFNQIAIVAKHKLTGYYLINVEVYDDGVAKYSLLLTIDEAGNLISGLVGGFSIGWLNKHGTVTREFTVTKGNLIQISEGSVGDNTVEYGLTASYRPSKKGELELKNISIRFK